jgi:TonB-linked SusC/RagA family outer membrane protein
MRKILRLFLTLSLGFLLLPSVVQAQERTITGTIVSDDSKTPLSGVTVRVKGTRRIVTTDAEGKFTLKVNPGETLQVSYVGYETTDIKSGDAATISVSLKAADNTMGEVVVTAMDIKRNPRELGYSVQTVDGKDIQETQRENFLNSLQGRVAGLTINSTSGNAGSSSQIVLRGFNSLSLSNQPLFVIDGVIVDNQTIDENSNGGTGVGLVERGAGLTNTSNKINDYSNRISDMNPNDIESITVLKGPEATALYGSQASSGAIIITTRKAKTNKLAIQYDNSFRIQEVTRYPEVFDAYAPGSNGTPTGVFRYFGPKYPEGTKLYDNKNAFFKQGFSQTHNLGVDFGVKNSIFRLSGSFFDQDGIIPTNTYRRYTIKLSNTTKFGKMIDVSPAISVIRTENDKVLRGAGGFLLALLSWPNTNDIVASQGDNGTKIPLFSANPNTDFDNPLFNVNNNKSREVTNRYNASIGINIRPYSWLALSGRFGYETYSTDGYLRYHPLSYYIGSGIGGIQDNYNRRYFGYNHTITATAKKTLGKDFNFRLMVGTMWQDYETQMFAVSGEKVVDTTINGQMFKNVNGVLTLVTGSNYNQIVGALSDSNATRAVTRRRLLRNNFGEYNRSIIRQGAYFGEIAFNYKNLFFVSYTQRFEEASTLPAKNRKFNYPGGSVSLIVSDLFPTIKKGNVLNYMKIRGSLAQTARLNSPYSTQSFFVNSFASGGGFSYGFFNNNAELLPERQNTFEIGTEMRFLKSRFTLDITYYNTLNKAQIVENMRLSYGTGFVLNTYNAASTRNRGLEIVLDAGIVKKEKFSWNMRFNFNKMKNKLEALPANLSLYYLADNALIGNVGGGAVLGGTTTAISGFGYLRNNKGDILINPTSGLPVIDGVEKVRGERNPDFVIGWLNNITYRNWKLNFLWDLKIGGDIYNGTKQYLTTIGRSMMTADRETPRIITGVLQNGLENSATPTVNTIAVIPQNNDLYYRNMPEEEFIEKDVNWFRLRDITLNYSFPANFVNRIRGLKTLSAFVTLNDVFLLTNYSGADPAVNGNTSGTRGVGTFGFDYGTMPNQLSANVGIRASF